MTNRKNIQGQLASYDRVDRLQGRTFPVQRNCSDVQLAGGKNIFFHKWQHDVHDTE